jgi:hypothetical protein
MAAKAVATAVAVFRRRVRVLMDWPLDAVENRFVAIMEPK